MKPTTIAIVLPRQIDGGIRTHLSEIIPKLKEKGHRIVIIASTKHREFIDSSIIPNKSFLIHQILVYGIVPWSIIGLHHTIDKCDLIHIHAYPHFLCDYLTIARYCHKKPVVITFHGSFHQYTSYKTFLLKKIHNSIMLRFSKFVDKFIAVSHSEKTEVVKHGIPENKIDVIYNGIPKRFTEPLAKINHGKEQKQILYLGRLTNTKNPELLIEAMPFILNQVNNVKLIIAGGDWGAKKNLLRLSFKCGVSHAIEFTGVVSEEQKYNLYISSDLFVHPSLQDIFSISILEAAATELPPIAFNTQGNSEMIIDWKTGRLVTPFTAKALAEAIIQTLNNPVQSHDMGIQARQFVLKTFTWQQAVEDLEKTYYSIIQSSYTDKR